MIFKKVLGRIKIHNGIGWKLFYLTISLPNTNSNARRPYEKLETLVLQEAGSTVWYSLKVKYHK
jgi:hypothetical protein